MGRDLRTPALASTNELVELPSLPESVDLDAHREALDRLGVKRVQDIWRLRDRARMRIAGRMYRYWDEPHPPFWAERPVLELWDENRRALLCLTDELVSPRHDVLMSVRDWFDAFEAAALPDGADVLVEGVFERHDIEVVLRLISVTPLEFVLHL